MSRSSQPTLPDEDEIESPPSTERKPAPPGYVYLHQPTPGCFPVYDAVAALAAINAVRDTLTEELRGSFDANVGKVKVTWHEATGPDREHRDGFYLVKGFLKRWRAYPPADLRHPEWRVETLGEA